MSFPSLTELVPHRPPMLLLDEVVAFDGERVRCRVTLRPDAPFARGGRIPGWTALEYCAQCVAAFAGLSGRRDGDAPPRIGFLIAARELVLELDAFETGDVLLVEARRIFGEARLGHFECTVERAGCVVAKASLSVYQPEDRDAGPRPG